MSLEVGTVYGDPHFTVLTGELAHFIKFVVLYNVSNDLKIEEQQDYEPAKWKQLCDCKMFSQLHKTK